MAKIPVNVLGKMPQLRFSFFLIFVCIACKVAENLITFVIKIKSPISHLTASLKILQVWSKYLSSVGYLYLTTHNQNVNHDQELLPFPIHLL